MKNSPLFAAVLVLALLGTAHAEAPSFRTSFGAATSFNGAVTKHTTTLKEPLEIGLPKEIEAAGWNCFLSPALSSEDGGHRLQIVVCMNAKVKSGVSTAVVCAADERDSNMSSMILTVANTKVAIVLSCVTASTDHEQEL